MAHFAKLELDNIVTMVVTLDNINCMTPGGIEKEEIGVEYLTKHHQHENWKKCSYNTSAGVHRNGGTPFRANSPGTGWYYNSEYDIFHPPKPENCESWTLNTTTGFWDPPIPQPELTEQELMDGRIYNWYEDLYQEDNTKGWKLEFRDPPTD